MAQLKFTPIVKQNAPGSYQPDAAPDITSGASTNNQNLLQSLRSQAEMNRLNAAATAANNSAGQAAIMNMLKDFSPKAVELGQKLYQDDQNRRDAEFILDVESGKVQIEDDLIQNQRQADGVLLASTSELQAEAVRNDNGATPGFAANTVKLSNLTGARAVYAKQRVLGNLTQKYEQDLKTFDLSGETDPAVVKQRLQEYKAQWLIDHGVSTSQYGARSILAYFMPEFTKASKAAEGRIFKTLDDQTTVNEQESMRQSILSRQLTAQDFVRRTMGLINPKTGNAYTPSEAHDLWEKTLVELVDTKQLSSIDVEAIHNTPDNLSGEKYADKWKTRAAGIMNRLAEENRKNYADDEADLQMGMKQEVDDFLFQAAQTTPTERTVEDFKRYIFKNYGGHGDRRLDDLLSGYTIEAEDRKYLDQQFENLLNMGLLTPEMVSSAPIALRQKYDPLLKQYGSAIAGIDMKAQLKMIEGEVKSNPLVKVSPNDGSTGAVTQMVIAELQAKFQRKVSEKVGLGLPGQQAVQQAMAETLAEFGGAQNGSARYRLNNRGEFENFREAFFRDTSQTAKQTNDRINKVNKAIAYGGKASLDKMPGLIFDANRLQAIERGYGQPGWTLPPEAQYWANKLNMNPLDIINRQRKAAGMKELATPQAIELTKGSIQPEFQYLFNRYPSPMRSIRGLSSSRQWVPGLVPGGYGQVVERAARANGIDPAILAGLIETESSWNPKARSKAGARGIAQIMPQYHPGVNYDDPVASINYAAKHLKGLLAATGGDLNRAIKAYNGGMGGIDKSDENRRYLPKVLTAAAKYGYGQAWNNPATMRGKFRAIEYLSGDPNHRESYRADHSGSNYHDHIAFATRQERDAAIKKLTAAGIQVGSVDRPGDPGNHGKGLAIDIPGSQVPVGQEKELSRRVRSILGIS